MKMKIIKFYDIVLMEQINKYYLFIDQINLQKRGRKFSKAKD